MTPANAPSPHALWVTAPGVAEIRPVALAAMGEDTVRVRSLYGAISRGTESLVFRGEVPKSEYQRMRAPFQEGNFPAPVKYGYINVGRVEAGPEHLSGRTVFCLFPHQTHYVVPAASVTVVPDTVPASRAVLAANLETAVNALWDAGPRIGESISIVGAGAVGCLTAWLAGAIPGCRVQLIDTNADRAALAGALGVEFASPDHARDDVDLVIHASGSAVGLSTALAIAGFEATIVEMSWYGTSEVSVPLGSAFHSRRLRLQSSQVGHIATGMRARWDYRRRLALVFDLLSDPVLDILISDECRFDDLPVMLKRLSTTDDPVLCQRVIYP